MLGLLQLSVIEKIAYFESTIIINELMNETVRHIFTKSDSEKKFVYFFVLLAAAIGGFEHLISLTQVIFFLPIERIEQTSSILCRKLAPHFLKSFSSVTPYALNYAFSLLIAPTARNECSQ